MVLKKVRIKMKITIVPGGGINLTVKEKMDIEKQIKDAIGTYLKFDGGSEQNIEVVVCTKDHNGKYFAKISSTLPVWGKI